MQNEYGQDAKCYYYGNMQAILKIFSVYVKRHLTISETETGV